MLDYSIKNNYKKDSILLLANVATRKIANSNTIIDIKKYGGNNKKDIFLYDSIGKTQIDSIIVLSTALNKNGINILKETAQERQEATNNQLVLFILLALLFFTNLALAYLYFKNDFKKKKQVNKVLLYNSTLLQNSYDAIITIDNNYIITDWTVHAENLYGYSAKEAKGESILRLFTKNEHDTEKLRGPMFVNDVWKGEATQDITAMKETGNKLLLQKELFESEQKFRTLVQQASDGIIITDEDDNLLDVNDTAASLTGYKKEELETLNTDDIFFDEGRIKRPMHFNAVANGAVVISEHIIKRKGGKLINVEVSAKQLSDGRYQRILRDITKRKQVEDALRSSEKKYRLLFDDNPLPMWITSITDNRFMDVNNAALKSYGYTKEEFLKMKLSDLDVPKRNSILEAEQIFEYITKDAIRIIVNIITHDITHEGKPAILYLANDITAKFEAEESLQKSNEALRELASHLENIREKERSHMAREIHDELGQQLTGLKMDISWINRKIKSDDIAVQEKMKDTIALIDKTVITVRRMATQLRPSILDDLGLIAAMEWQSEEFEKRAEITSVFNSNVSQVNLSTDIATAVFRIFQESLTNVLRHSKATEVISFFKLDKDIITLFIEDNGIGFKEEEIKNKKTLGLLGMKERIQLINGRYEINGNTGKGTSVIITVPLI